MENENVVTMNEEVEVEVIEKKENIFTKGFKAIGKAGKVTGAFLKEHIGGVVTVAVVIIGGVAYYLIKNGTNEEMIPVEDDDTIDTTDKVTEEVKDNVVNF